MVYVNSVGDLRKTVYWPLYSLDADFISDPEITSKSTIILFFSSGILLSNTGSNL